MWRAICGFVLSDAYCTAASPGKEAMPLSYRSRSGEGEGETPWE